MQGGNLRGGVSQRSRGIKRPVRRYNTSQEEPTQQYQRRVPVQGYKTQQRLNAPHHESATGNPIHGKIEIPTIEQLKALQVKAELNKLGAAPRAYFTKLDQVDESMMDEFTSGRMTLGERF